MKRAGHLKINSLNGQRIHSRVSEISTKDACNYCSRKFGRVIIFSSIVFSENLSLNTYVYSTRLINVSIKLEYDLHIDISTMAISDIKYQNTKIRFVIKKKKISRFVCYLARSQSVNIIDLIAI